MQKQLSNLEQKPQFPSNSTMKQHLKNNCQSEKTHNKTQEIKAKKSEFGPKIKNTQNWQNLSP